MQQYLVLLAADSSVFSPQSNFGHIHVPTIRPPSHFSISLKIFLVKVFDFLSLSTPRVFGSIKSHELP